MSDETKKTEITETDHEKRTETEKHTAGTPEKIEKTTEVEKKD